VSESKIDTIDNEIRKHYCIVIFGRDYSAVRGVETLSAMRDYLPKMKREM
jgi:hypothetical protein